MTVFQRVSALVAMPGTGSDADYVQRAFGRAARHLDVELIAPQPTAHLVEDYLHALDAAALNGPILVGGVSIGASVATSWAIRNPDACAGILAALPPWTGDPTGSVAAASAAATAVALRRDGLDRVITEMMASSPAWLADELSRSWRVLYPDLLPQLDAAATFVGPTLDELSGCDVPLAIVAATDDPIHPIDVARDWFAAAPRTSMRTVTLSQWGADPGVLGDACVGALAELIGS